MLTRRLTWAFVTAVLLTAFTNAPADARQHRKSKHHTHHYSKVHIASAPRATCDDRYPMNCGAQTASRERYSSGRMARADSRSIPNPPGTWRVAQSCAHRLAAYWGLGKGLDKVSTWPQVFSRASGPAVGLAAVRGDRHHIMGIIGGGPGAWRVADFNSDGRHGNQEYTVANFGGYFFVDPRIRTASR